MAQLLDIAHRVDRHHHGGQPLDGIEGDDELRAVLHVQQHAVGAFYAAALLQPAGQRVDRSEEHTSDLQSLMSISYAVFCLKKKQKYRTQMNTTLISRHNTIPQQPTCTPK